jgi:hypothetical protein
LSELRFLGLEEDRMVPGMEGAPFIPGIINATILNEFFTC